LGLALLGVVLDEELGVGWPDVVVPVAEPAFVESETGETAWVGPEDDSAGALVLFAATGFDGLGLESPAVEVGGVAGFGVVLGSSSGSGGASAAAGEGAVDGGSSAGRDAAVKPNRAKAMPLASANRRARDARAVDTSTGDKSIEFCPADLDALRNGSRLAHSVTEIEDGGEAMREVRARISSTREFESS
jgi:hypothetical protein